MGVLSPDCYACRGIGYVKAGFGDGAPGIAPGYGVGAPGAYGAPAIPPPMPPAYGAGMYPPPVQQAYGAYGAYEPPIYNPTFMPPPPDYF